MSVPKLRAVSLFVRKSVGNIAKKSATQASSRERMSVIRVVRKVGNAVHRLNHYPVDSATQSSNSWGLVIS